MPRIIKTEEIKAYIEKRKGTFLSHKKCAHAPGWHVKYKCKKGHDWTKSPHDLVKKGKWCKICSGKEKKSPDYYIALAESRGGKCKTPYVKNQHEKIKWECAQGHKWWASGNKVAGSKKARVLGVKSVLAITEKIFAGYCLNIF